MKKRLTTYFLLILMFGSGVQAQEFESATVAVKNMGVGCSFTTGTSPCCEIIKCGWPAAVRTYLMKHLVWEGTQKAVKVAKDPL